MQNKLESYHLYQREWDNFDQIRDAFEWECPDEFNIASYICDRWATGDQRVALYAENSAGDRREVTYDDLGRRANALANFLAQRGVSRGDRIGICLPPRPEAMIVNIAAWKLGAISVPLSTLFGPEAIEYRMTDCDARVAFVDESTADTFRDTVDLETFVLVDDTAQAGETDYGDILADYSSEFETVGTDPEDDACIIYTSGTTGDPKGVLHAHRFVLGMLPFVNRCFMQDNTTDGEVWWTPVDWSWVAAMGNILPALFFGIKHVAYDGGEFDPERAFELIDRYDVTVFGCPPTVLRMMQTVERPGERFDVSTLRMIVCGGETLEEATIDWVDKTFDGATVQETYGQTESGMNIADFHPPAPIRHDKMGIAMPGQEVEIVDPETGKPTVETGEIGEIAVRYESNLGCFKEYWNKPEKTEQKIQNGWLLTEDLGTVDEDGYFSFATRKDDIIISSGYKISPQEIEETLGTHDAVFRAGVIAAPHEERGEIPRAYVSLVEDAATTEDLRQELQAYVKDRLAKYEYPRELEFVESLPRTNTGKVSRQKLREQAGHATS
jgi:acetyl-CoA synthetase